jgi:phage-related protein
MSLGCRFHRTASGAEPVRDWLRGLDQGAKTMIGADIRVVQDNWPVGKPLVDGFGGGLYEVRSTVNRMEYRVLFCIVDSNMVLLHGVVKKSKKTPQADIGLARRRQKEVTDR